MNHTIMKSSRLMLLFLLTLSICIPGSSAADTAARTFPTPQAAADALITAAETFDVPALEQILGPGGKEVIHSGEPARDREIAKQFAEQARTKMNVSVAPKTKTRAFIMVGDDNWPFPVPLVKSGT